MANTNIKAGMFYGVVGHGTDGYFLMSNGDGSMTWGQASTGPSVTSVTYPGDDTAADPAGGQTVVLTGTGFATSGMTVTIGGTAAPSVAHTSNTQLTITTPAKAAGDYDIVVTNGVTGASGTFVNGISYNGVPTWTTAAGSLGTFESSTTISTITLQATEPDGGTITFNITNGALPTGLSLSGANINGTTTAETSTTLYSFTIEAIDDENQSTPRNFSITVNAAFVNTENFDIVTYTGNGSTQSITSLDFQPDLVLTKSRSFAEKMNVFDSVRGATKRIYTAGTHAEAIQADSLTSFNSNGWSIGAWTDSNTNNATFVSYAFKGGGIPTLNNNTQGTIASTVSANPNAGFSIVKYTGNGGTTQSVGHGLSSAPELVIFKRTNAVANWFVFEKSGASTRRFEGLNTTNASTSDTFFTPSSSTITWTGTTADFNGNTNEYIMYCFHSVDGYQKVGSYVGNGSSGGQTITGLGFNPRFLLVKNATASASWRITDSVRGNNIYLYPNSTNADDSNSGYTSLITDGFRLNGLDSNTSDTFIYLAIA